MSPSTQTGIAIVWGVPVLAILVFVFLKIVLFRLFKPRNWFLVLVGLYAALLPLVFAAGYLAFRGLQGELAKVADMGRLMELLHPMGLLGLLFLPCLTFYSMVDHSVRVRVSVEFFRSPTGRLSLQELLVSYDPSNAAARRVQKVIDGQYAQLEGDFYVLTPKGRAFAVFFWRLKRFFGLAV